MHNLQRGKNKFPDFMIIGAQKAGTTSLHNYLCQHPLIDSATKKEIHFFSSDFLYSKGLDYYHSTFPFTNDDLLFFDASPSYLASNVAYKRIYEYNPKIKMIALLRDPVDRAYSAWNMYRTRYLKNRNWFFDDWVSFVGKSPDDYVKRTDEEVYNFDVFVKNEIQHLSLSSFNSIEASILPQGFYQQHLSKFFSLFPREQLLVLESSYFRKYTSKALENIESFLSIRKFDWDSVNLSPIFEGYYSDTLDQSTAYELSSFYAPHNEDLYRQLEVRFDWK
jgi:hypothetical protein